MHPEKKEKVENEADNSETVQGNKEDDEQWKGRTEASEVKRQEDLKKVRQELGLETAPVERLTGTLGKVQEYDERIRAVRAGKPIKTTDKEDSLLASFKSFVKQDWSEDFDMNRFQKEREARKRIDEIKPIDITQINENSGIERGKFDSKQISFKQEGEFVKRFYAGQPWGSFEGNLIEQVIQGKKIRIIVMNKASDAHASFEPFSDTYTIGTKAREEFEKDPEMFLASMNHEVSHDEFFSLNEETQRKVGDLFLQDPGLKDILKKFSTTIYTDKFIFNEKETGGQHYLMVHDVNNKATNETTLSLEGQKGLKDVRSIVFEIGGEKKEVFVGLLITELISSCEISCLPYGIIKLKFFIYQLQPCH